MTAAYQRELDFTISVLRRLRLTVHLLRPEDSIAMLDAGLRGVLGMQTDYDAAMRINRQWTQARTVYKVLDQFLCHYIYFHLPGTDEPLSVVIGPYLTVDPTQEMLLEQAERLGLPMHQLAVQAEFYASLPVFNDPSVIIAVVASLGEVLWGGPEGFHMVDVNSETMQGLSRALSIGDPEGQEDVLQRMQQMEERYAYENELMDIVSRGQTNRAEVMMASVSQLNYQARHADPLRNMKNYCIICNTILRKAAQKGGVHPLYLDRTSGDYARRIENAPTLHKASALIGEMIRGYCRLVRTHAGRQYSPAVQKAITYIDENLSGELTLGGLAKLLQLSPGYLSALFHRETGSTLAGHINERRMKAALQLLASTRLQVQTVAQLSGFTDPNYFSRQFRRFYGLTPLQYRRELMVPAAQEDGGPGRKDPP